MSENNHDNCPLSQALLRIGGKWKPLIIYHMYNSRKRFGQLDAIIPKISRKVLTTSLNELVRDELVTRHSYQEIPPKVEYQLTEKARELIPILQDLADWGIYLIEKKSISNGQEHNQNCFVSRDEKPHD